MNDVRVCSLCGHVYIYDEFENNGYEDVCNHCKPIKEFKEEWEIISTEKNIGRMHPIRKAVRNDPYFRRTVK